MKKLLMFQLLLTGLLLVGICDVALATFFNDTLDFTDSTTGGPNPVTYREFVNNDNYTHKLLGLTTPPFTLEDASLTLRHNGNSANRGELWFADSDYDNSFYIGQLSESRGANWTTDKWDLNPGVLDFMGNSSPWELTVCLYDITPGIDKIKIDYSILSGNYTETSGGSPVPEPATMLLLGSGLVGFAGFGRRFRKK